MIALLVGLAFGGDGGCGEGGLEIGAATVNPRPGDLGTGFRPCARDVVGLDLGGALVVDSDNFYGSIVAAGILDGSKAIGDLRLHASVEVVRLDMLISAFSDSKLGFGHTMVGAQYPLVQGDSLLVLADARLVLPTASALYAHARPFAMDLGVGLDGKVSPWLRLHAHAAGLGSLAFSAAPSGPWAGLDLKAGAEARAGKVFSFVLDVDGTLGYAGKDGLEGIVVANAVRVAIGRVGIELGAWAPIFTTKRQPYAVELRVSYRFD
jgi:hypothetical protein